MGKILVINNADFSDVAVKQVTFQAGSYINVSSSLEEANSLVSGSGFYAIGETATVSAANNNVYRFVKWNDGNTDATRTIIITDKEILNFVAEYEIILNTNSFTWSNGGITSVRNSSGSLNRAATTTTYLIHTLQETTFKINPEYKNDFVITAYAVANSNVTAGKTWQDVGQYFANVDVTELTVAANKYCQICIYNTKNVSFTSDLSLCAQLLLVTDTVELT